MYNTQHPGFPQGGYPVQQTSISPHQFNPMQAHQQPQYQHPSPSPHSQAQQLGFPPQMQQPQQQSQQGPSGPGLTMPSNLTAMMAQGYAAQQQLVQAQQHHQPTPQQQIRPPISGGGIPGMQGMGAPSMQQLQSIQEMQMRQQQAMHSQQMQHHVAQHQMNQNQVKKKKHRPPLPSNTQRPPPARPTEAYVKAAMNPPAQIEPWSDMLDELDARELAMQRFRTRQEVLAEIFGPESIKDIPRGRGDAWEGLGMDGESLEAKVLALEKENEELEAQGEQRVEQWNQSFASSGQDAVTA